MSLDTLNAIYASGNVSPIVTLSFECTYNNNATITNLGNYYLGFGDTKTLDSVVYSPSSFQVAVPGKNDSGFTDLNFAICNVDNIIYNTFKSYKSRMYRNDTQTYVYLRQFNPETLEKEYELKLTITGVQFTRTQANFTASFCDMLNTEFPKLRYTSYNCPGLKYVSD